MLWQYAPRPEQAWYPVREMLVNFADGPVRRGISGDVILSLTDSFGGTPVAWASAVLTLLGVSLFAASITIFRKLPNDSALTPLVLAPWGLMFIAYDQDIMIRKEAFGYLALCLVLLGATSKLGRSALVFLAFGSVMMPLAILMHEVNAVLVGPMLIATWMLAKKHRVQTRVIGFLVATGFAASLASVVFTLTHLTASPAAICAAIQDPWCHAPFSYFDDTFQDGLEFVEAQISVRDMAVAALLFLVLVLPFLGVRISNTGRGTHLILGAIIVLPVIPLFIVAADYGRWFMLLTFPTSLLIATAISQGLMTYHRFLPHWATLLYCGTWSIYHYRVDVQVMGWIIWPLLCIAITLRWILPRRRSPQTTQGAP